jgi:hypothetical protein
VPLRLELERLAAAGMLVPIGIYLFLGVLGLSSLPAETILLAVAFTPLGWLICLLLATSCCCGAALLAAASVAVDAATADTLELLATEGGEVDPPLNVDDEQTAVYAEIPTGWS